jgi:DNA-binding response OmpR family regulator
MSDRATVSVLVVEDDSSMARLMMHLLELDGYQSVHHAWTGADAVAAADTVEIILLDQQLPDAKGIDLLPHLLDRPHPPSVIMVTAHGSEVFAATALRQGAEDYLTKDHTLAELLPRVLERVRRSRALQGALIAAEDDLLEAERLAAIGEMSVRLHHEINSPLMAALVEVEMALEAEGIAEEVRGGLRNAKEALLRVRTAVRTAVELPTSESTEYMTNTRITVFEKAPVNDRPTYLGRVVLHVPDPRVARVLDRLLRQEGFEVERCPSALDIPRQVERVGVTAVIVTSGSDRENPLGGFVPEPTRTYAVIALGTRHDTATRAAGADLVLPLPFDPATIVTEIRNAIGDRR